MQIDPRLQHLQALIEQKRSRLNSSQSQSNNIRQVNPKFAEATKRVQNHLQNKGLKPLRPYGVAENVVTNSSAGNISASQNINKVERGESTSSGLSRASDKLSLLSGKSSSLIRPGEEHLGHYIDLYA